MSGNVGGPGGGPAPPATLREAIAAMFHFEWVDRFKERFESQIADAKAVFDHLKLYIGLLVYTALGAWVFSLIEHAAEREKLAVAQTLLLEQRENFLNLIYNLTSQLEASGASVEGEGANLYAEETIKSMLLATNAFRPAWQTQDYYSLEKMVRRVDSALLDYEQTVAVAADEGIDMANKEVSYNWDYTQAFFFSSTVITTVGYGHIAPSTTGGRVFCLFFAIIGIPFTLTVLADVGAISATMISVVWGKIKPLIEPFQKQYKQLEKRWKRRRKIQEKRKQLLQQQQSLIADAEAPAEAEAGSTVALNGGLQTKTDGDLEVGSAVGSMVAAGSTIGVTGGAVYASSVSDDAESKKIEDLEDEDEEEEPEEEDPFAAMDLSANILMVMGAIGALLSFLSVSAYLFTIYEDWSFFDAIYFCFITMTTIGFGDMVPTISADESMYMGMSMLFILVGLSFFSTIINMISRQYNESWRKMQELKTSIQAQLKLAENLRKMAEQGKDVEGMDIDLDALRAQLEKFKKSKFGKFFDLDLDSLDWINKRKVKAVTIFFYETSV